MIPKSIVIGGVPFPIIEKSAYFRVTGNVSYYATLDTSMAVDRNLPYDRQVSYVFNEMAALLLYMVGWEDKDVDAFQYHFATGLHILLSKNSFDWIRDGSSQDTDQVCVGNVKYTIRYDLDEELEPLNHMGEARYTKLELPIRKDISSPDMKDWVLIHEITHALLYEANYPGDHNDDKIVTPLGTLLYQFIQNNDLDWVREQGKVES